MIHATAGARTAQDGAPDSVALGVCGAAVVLGGVGGEGVAGGVGGEGVLSVGGEGVCGGGGAGVVGAGVAGGNVGALVGDHVAPAGSIVGAGVGASVAAVAEVARFWSALLPAPPFAASAWNPALIFASLGAATAAPDELTIS